LKPQANIDGRYHILNGVISALNGIGPDDINLGNLKQRIKDEGITEVIISTNPTLDGEMTAYYINNLLKDELDVYRIGYGLPAGTNIEYANETTLIKALEGKGKCSIIYERSVFHEFVLSKLLMNMNSLGTTLVSTTFGVNVPYFNITKSTF